MPGVAKAWNEFATNARIKDLDKRIEARRVEQAGITTPPKKKKKRENTFNARERINQIKGVNKTRRDIMMALEE